MSQVTLCDVQDVKTVSTSDLVMWSLGHSRYLRSNQDNSRYKEAVKNDLKLITKELDRRNIIRELPTFIRIQIAMLKFFKDVWNQLPRQWWCKWRPIGDAEERNWHKTSWKNVLLGQHRGDCLRLGKG